MKINSNGYSSIEQAAAAYLSGSREAPILRRDPGIPGRLASRRDALVGEARLPVDRRVPALAGVACVERRGGGGAVECCNCRPVVPFAAALFPTHGDGRRAGANLRKTAGEVHDALGVVGGDCIGDGVLG